MTRTAHLRTRRARYLSVAALLSLAAFVSSCGGSSSADNSLDAGPDSSRYTPQTADLSGGTTTRVQEGSRNILSHLTRVNANDQTEYLFPAPLDIANAWSKLGDGRAYSAYVDTNKALDGADNAYNDILSAAGGAWEYSYVIQDATSGVQEASLRVTVAMASNSTGVQNIRAALRRLVSVGVSQTAVGGAPVNSFGALWSDTELLPKVAYVDVANGEVIIRVVARGTNVDPSGVAGAVAAYMSDALDGARL